MSTTLPSPRSSARRTAVSRRRGPSIAALQAYLYDDPVVSRRVRDLVAALDDRPDPPGATAGDRIRIGYALLRRITRDLGGAQAIAADLAVGTALCDWCAQLGTHVLPYLTGHIDLTVAAIERLGTGAAYQRARLAELNSTAAVGVLLITELGYGSTAIDLETRATWHPDATHSDGGWFDLHSSSAAALKMPPNAGALDVAKTVIVAARLIVDGDEGVWPFLVQLRTARGGLAPGVTVVALPPSPDGPIMDNAIVDFDHVRIPRDALLCGGFAQFDDAGFHCALDHRARFAAGLGGLLTGRLKLARASVASARAGLALTVRYTQQRQIHEHQMLDLDNVRRDLVPAMAAVYAMTALGRHATACVAAEGQSAAELVMLAKPLMSDTARDILDVCRDRLAGQSIHAANYVGAYSANLRGMRIAEGENQALLIAAGTRLARPDGSATTALHSADTALDLPWWHRMIHDRQQIMTSDVRAGRTPAGVLALGRKSAEIELARAHAERLAVDAASVSAARTGDARTRAVVEDMAAIYGLTLIRAHSDWYAVHDRYTPRTAARVDAELRDRILAVAPHLPALVAAFGLPQTTAPIDSDDHARAWAEHAGLRRLLDDDTAAASAAVSEGENL
ncbi:acyl-CoA dehydrogenase family protein [Nocardia blacklockiae]|uniref:acyl-CoA dehydrogenase family protein n=1 Tax=Nocardia blacklockiae TaxID=480036 RepID=UPI00189551DC|nr:acyl-CoA dehydrogenase family protein [Nocardia blacklockiae]MBF6171143.1 hypothetical protein [Nocardia blacklockiae]